MSRFSACLLALALATVMGCGAGTASVTAARLPRDARFELLGALESVIYPPGTTSAAGFAPDGAVGVNAAWERGAGPGLYIEEQRHGEEAILDGLVRRQPRLWRAGLRAFAWGFARQGRDGGFPHTHDAFHSTSFFVEGVAHTILVVRAGAASRVALPRGLARTLERWIRPLRAAARWMARSDVWRAGIASDAPYTHRRFLVAAALGLTAELTGDGGLRRRAHEALELGLGKQRRDGVFPELGGHDSSYQARGIAYAEQYLAWVTDRAHARLAGAIGRGIGWEQGRVRSTGEVVTAGNTRANGVMRDHNGVKRVVYPMVARALTWWGLLAARPRLVRLGAVVVAWGARHPGQVGR